MGRYLHFKNWMTGEVSTAVDVTGKGEREVGKIERGMLINCNVEGGWFVDDYEADAPHDAQGIVTEGGDANAAPVSEAN